MKKYFLLLGLMTLAFSTSHAMKKPEKLSKYGTYYKQYYDKKTKIYYSLSYFAKTNNIIASVRQDSKDLSFSIYTTISKSLINTKLFCSKKIDASIIAEGIYVKKAKIDETIEKELEIIVDIFKNETLPKILNKKKKK
ncbi:hypothetical protein ACFLYU_02720 [Candidatus Dependentiae bacterium]